MDYQGSVLGTILFLLYLTDQKIFSNISYHFYADDILIYCSLKENELNKLMILSDCLSAIKQCLNNHFFAPEF